MDISVIICTYNRCESLRQTLQTCCELEIPEGTRWELLVVDNNSTDATKLICESSTGKLPLRYIFEPRQGLSVARNRGVQEALAPLLVFTDDDVDIDANWLAGYWRAFQTHPEASFFGGRIHPKWTCEPPHWLKEYQVSLLAGMAAFFDRGETAHYTDSPFFGGNMAFNKVVFTKGRGFRADLGVNGSEPAVGEETYLMQGLLAEGYKGLYVPAAIVHHRNPAAAGSEKHLREWFKGQGITDVRLGVIAPGHKTLFGAPGYLWRQWATQTWVWIVNRWLCPFRVWVPMECAMARTWGQICEFRQRTRQPAATIRES